MSDNDPGPTVPRTPPVVGRKGEHVPTDDTGTRAAGRSDPDRTLFRRPSEPSDAEETAPRAPSDTSRQEAAARARDADGVPGYAILRELGRGGMGVVYEARHLKLNRVVALKLMLGGGQERRVEMLRFLAEAEAVAAVRHPNVVQVYDYGESDGRPYMALEYCPGGTLTELLPRSPGHATDPLGMAELLSEVARGVAAAHTAGIVHRDLKPGNVFLDADGVPKVADFGLAKRREGSDMTQTGVGMGTPAYMAPEQAKDAKFVGPQADVWALGVMLYQALTGTRPFAADGAMELMIKIGTDAPTPPRAVVRSVPRDLELICLKCLAKAPHERYPTGKEVADDLDRFSRNEPISVRPAGPLERGYKWVVRHPTLAALWAAGGCGLVLAVLAAAVVWLWQSEETARAAAERTRDTLDIEKRATETALRGEAAAKGEIDRQRKHLARLEYGRTVQVAYHTWKSGKVAGARVLLASCPSELRGWEWHYVRRLCYADRLTLDGHTSSVFVAVYDRPGSKILTAGMKDVARVWDATTGVLVAELKGHGGRILTAAFSPDGSKVVTASQDLTARVWDAGTGRTIVELRGHTGQVYGAAFHPDGARVVTAGQDGTARVWDAAGKQVLALRGHAAAVTGAAFSPDGSMILTASSDGTARVWGAAGERIAELGGHPKASLIASFGPKGTRVVTAARDGTVRVWDAATGKPVAELKGHRAAVTAAAFDPSETRVLTASADGTARVRDATTGKAVAELSPDGGVLVAAAFSPDGARVLAAGEDGVARVWEADGGRFIEEFRGHDGPVLAVAFRPDGAEVATAGGDGTARIWSASKLAPTSEFLGHAARARTGLTGRVEKVQSVAWTATGARAVTTSYDMLAGFDTPVARDLVARVWSADGGSVVELRGHTHRVVAAALSPDGATVVTGSLDGTARVWDATTGRAAAVLRGHEDNVHAVSFSPDGAKVATASPDRTVRVWDPATGRGLGELRRYTSRADVVSFSPDGSKAVTVGSDDVARVWDVGGGIVNRELRGHAKSVLVATFSPDGSKVLTAGWDGTARVWEAATGALVAELKEHTGGVLAAAFSPDGSKVVTTGEDGTAFLWDVGGGRPVVLRGHAGQVTSATFSPDGSRVATAGADGTVRVWDEVGTDLLALPGWSFVSFSADGKRLLTGGATTPAVVYDSRPVNAAQRDGR